MGIFASGVKKTNLNFFQKIGRAISGKSRVDDNVLDALEEALLASDMGVDTTLRLIENIEDRVEKDKYVDLDELTACLSHVFIDKNVGDKCLPRRIVVFQSHGVLPPLWDFSIAQGKKIARVQSPLREERTGLVHNVNHVEKSRDPYHTRLCESGFSTRIKASCWWMMCIGRKQRAHLRLNQRFRSPWLSTFHR